MQFQMMSEKEMAEALKYLRENEEDDMLRRCRESSMGTR